MWFLVDLAIILVIALCTFLGYKKGLIKVAFKILTFFVALLIAFVLYKPVSNFVINNTPIYDNVKTTIVEKLGEEDVENKEVTR